jgi:hypothetical protein
VKRKLTNCDPSTSLMSTRPNDNRSENSAQLAFSLRWERHEAAHPGG